ncbi:histidine kinase dimerization/phospho-acceptor domain-containing protein [Mucilaginibacter glaciei]|uniref:histidine kinase n=1 Tax=Mucilaginibacter glaciei TaxID=2772109 RepID=A0A926NGC0_9SPHI|nr:histidine kinase dimerization/phospho-acceptor domain-containing protein [Mucilaginibacter glaciei]MBD1391574.1 HAMP domain-containing protein [Mucilaginibacter glaciei]
MTLKQRFSFIFSCLFSFVLAAVMLIIYYLFANFRREEFADRLAEKAENTAKILVDVREIDYNMQKLLDRNSVRRLYNEKTLVFDDAKRLIYNSSDTTSIAWSNDELEELKTEPKIIRRKGKSEMVGLFYQSKGKNYYVLISAEDTYGNRKLVYLKYLLMGAFIISTLLIWFLSFFVSKRNLMPLDNFTTQIRDITDKNLNVRLKKAKHEDEINTLVSAFNQMMDRIDGAYNRQREFTGNASHELRTPVARIAAQLENILHDDELEPAMKKNLASIADDIFQLSEIISSLVALAEINNRQHSISLGKTRLDELVFNAAAQISAANPGFKLKFEIENLTTDDTELEVDGDETLLLMVMLNLLKNGYLYSDNRCVECIIRQKPTGIDVIFTNTGEVPDVTDTNLLFGTFYRGSNTLHKQGSGIGLGIVKRVLQYHDADVSYHIIDQNTNQVIVTFYR